MVATTTHVPASTSATAAALTWPTARWVYLRTAALAALVALVLAWSSSSMGSFADVLVFSECIGLSIATLSMLTYRLMPLARIPSPWDMVVSQSIAAPLGYFAGHALGRLLLGLPLTNPFGSALASGTSVAMVATVTATVIITLVMWLHAQRDQARRAQEQAQHVLAQAELRMLRAQLEPHMLFNTLANLRSLIEEDPQASLAMVDQFIAYLRGALNASRSNERQLSEEFAQVDAYLALMKHRFGDRLQWRTHLPPTLDHAAVPSFLLQPLVENAVRHGIEPLRDGGTVTLEAALVANQLVLTIRNDGATSVTSTATAATPTKPRQSDDVSTHYGLEHVRQRLQTMHGDAASFTLQTNQPNSTVATLTLPWQPPTAT